MSHCAAPNIIYDLIEDDRSGVIENHTTEEQVNGRHSSN